MTKRAMVVVAAGSASRFGADKLMADLGGRPLLYRTISVVCGAVDQCVVVTRPDLIDEVSLFPFDLHVVAGADTRTGSEMAGVGAVDADAFMIGVHDGARPLVTPELIDRLFAAAGESGGAVPVIGPDHPILDRSSLTSIAGVVRAQTPQVFRADVLREALDAAARDGHTGADTAALVSRYTACEIMTVAGEATNIKVTFPEDLDAAEQLLTDTSHI